MAHSFIRPFFFDRKLSRWTAWLVPVVLILLWEALARSGIIPARILPAPSSVVGAFWRLSESGEIWTHLGISFKRAAVGFLIGGSLGLFLGLVNGISRVSEVLLDSPLQMIRNIPHLALVPIVILWFGIGEEAKVFLVALGVVFPIYINTFHGIRSIDPGLLELARVYQLSRYRLFVEIIIPGALPGIILGVRFALGITWLTLIVAETIAANSGIGYMAMSAREFLETDVVVLTIILYALLGKSADSIAKFLEHTFLSWHHTQRSSSQDNLNYGVS